MGIIIHNSGSDKETEGKGIPAATGKEEQNISRRSRPDNKKWGYSQEESPFSEGGWREQPSLSNIRWISETVESNVSEIVSDENITKVTDQHRHEDHEDNVNSVNILSGGNSDAAVDNNVNAVVNIVNNQINHMDTSSYASSEPFTLKKMKIIYANVDVLTNKMDLLRCRCKVELPHIIHPVSHDR